MRRASRDDESISHLPILPPIWASLPSDPKLYDHPSPLRVSPSIITLDETSSCLCRAKYVASDSSTVIQKPCIIYGLTEPYECHIQLQSCPTCSSSQRRFIGPDGRNLGLFNYNNRILFTHELLNDYTSAYTSSETPFTAWVSVVSRRYTPRTSLRFVSEDLFRAVWFAFVKLQLFENDMQCLECGPQPEDVIWDGVTLAFGRKHIESSLRPPTTCHEKSVVRVSHYESHQQLIPSSTMRNLLRKVVTGRSLLVGPDELLSKSCVTSTGRRESVSGNNGPACEDVNSPTTGHTAALGTKAAADLLSRIRAIPDITEQLCKLDPALGTAFEENYGARTLLNNREAPPVYQRFFAQVWLLYLCVNCCSNLILLRLLLTNPSCSLSLGRL